MGFKEQLVKLRKRNNLTQSDLAEKLNVKQYVISAWETGRSEPSITQLSTLGDVFQISIDYLLDKRIMFVDSEDDFKKIIENTRLDLEDEFIDNVISICSDLSNNKKQKMLDIIKASIEFNK